MQRTRLIRLRWRRRLRKGQRQVEEISVQTEQQIDQLLFKRFNRLIAVQRFAIGWLCLMLLLIGSVVFQNLNLSNYYQTLETVPGGIYNEGVLGRFTNANPIFATSDADTTVSSLIFAGLLKYSAQGQLVGNLAQSYSVDSRGTTYTVHLKPNLTWQDGQPLTAQDVVFTYQTIQNPNTESPLQSAWQGVTISALNPTTVTFKLENPLASFPYSLTTGILPEHLLASVSPSDLRSANFNTVDPVGAGPFSWAGVQVSSNGDPNDDQEQIALKPFLGYNGGTPKLQKFVVQVYANQAQLIEAFKSEQLTALEGVDQIPNDVLNKSGVEEHSFTLRAANMVFFKTSTGVLSDQKVRQALVMGANVPQIIASLGYPAREVREPLLIGQLAYNSSYAQASYNLSGARSLLASDGWTMAKDGILTKGSQRLSFTLTAANTPDNQLVTGELRQQWKQLGVELNIQLLDSSDFQNAVDYHEYDAVLDGISIGIDPDVFVYWDSSQADIRSANRLNLSEYDNPTADESLEAGRTRLDPALRVIKYQPFLSSWQQNAPALGLYQPRLLYLTNGPVGGLGDQPLTTPTDRFANVQNWEINQAKVTD